MKFLFAFVLALILCFNSVICQEIDETRDEAELIPPLSTSPKGSDENPITSITNTVRNGTMGIFTRIADKISNSWNRIKNHMQDRYQRSIETLQRRAVDAMEKLQDYVKNRMDSTTDDNTKQYLERLNAGIQSITDALRNLMTSVETTIKKDGEQFIRVPDIPYKIDP